MLIKKPSDIPSSEITPQSVYINRRKFLAGATMAGAALVAGRGLLEVLSPRVKALAASKLNGVVKSPLSTTEKETSYGDVTHYNNFY